MQDCVLSTLCQYQVNYSGVYCQNDTCLKITSYVYLVQRLKMYIYAAITKCTFTTCCYVITLNTVIDRLVT